VIFNSLFSILFSLMGTGKVRTMTAITPSQLIHLISDVRVLQWVVNSFVPRDLCNQLSLISFLYWLAAFSGGGHFSNPILFYRL
jgi:hypothetical protein